MIRAVGKKNSATLIILSFTCTVFAQHPAGEAKKIGKVSEFYKNIKIETGQVNARTSKERSLPTNEAPLSAIINTSKIENGAEVIFGEIVGSKASNLSFTISNGSLEGFAVMPEEEKAYKYSSDVEGNVYVTEADIHDILCINYTKPQKAKDTGGDVVLAVPPSSSSVYNLQSLPGVTGVAYLDFDGEFVSGTLWNGGNPITAQPGNFTETEISNIWKMISEDFRSYNLNVTTNRAVFDAAPKNRRMMCIFTPTSTAAPGAGGVAYLNSFTWNDDTPCWVFNEGAKGAGEAGSHELGHTFGLDHDGNSSTEYYSGHGIWAPIMGVGYSKGLSQWSRGEYNNANQTEDDIAIIGNTTNGVGFRTDEAGNIIANAKALTVGATGTVTGSQNYGVVTQRTDIDVYSFTTGGGTVTLNIDPSSAYPDLDILARLTNASGTVLATANPTATAPGGQTGTFPITGLSASISMNLAAGTYYLHIDGTGQGDLATGYSDYASLGEYTISGTVPGSTGNVAPTVSILSPSNNTTFTAPATIAINASASDSDGSVTGVSFYNGSTLLSTDATSPYSFTWSNVAAGTYSITARATDNGGAITVSSTVTVSVSGVCTPTAITPYVQINAGSWSQANTASLNVGGSVKFGPQPVSGGSWAWSGPNGYTATTREITISNIQTNQAGNYLATYTNPSGCNSTQIFTITVIAPNQSPTVSVTSPANNASFTAPASITINATAADADGTVSSVSFYNGTTLLGTDTSIPYSLIWTNVAAGTYSITARATDNAGAVTTSSAVTVVINPSSNIAPTVSITSPANNASFTSPASITINATAADADGTVSGVSFYNGTTLLGTDATSPYSYSWPNVVAGTYSITARATDNAGAVTTSSTVSVVVNNVTTADILGVDCSTSNATVSFELNSSKRANATSYNWWYTGSVQSIGNTTTTPYIATILTGGNFSGGQVCVGVNYSVSPWHTSYCKSIDKCSLAQMGSLDDVVMSNEPSIYPNPSSSEFNFTPKSDVSKIEIINDLGEIIYVSEAINAGQNILLGNNLRSGLYILLIQYSSGRVESKKIQKTL